jgi:membrane associated rhomboid family serine protease
MSTRGPDLFVICKNCGSEVSPYITECPYCGSRLRKRAPKLDRDGRVTEKRRRRRPPTPSLPRLRRGEMPGIRAESHPYATIVLVLAGLAGTIVWRTALVDIHLLNLWFRLSTHVWWWFVAAPFTYTNTGYAFVTLGAIALFGWLIERRHGPLLVLVLFVLGALGGTGVALAVGQPLALGGNGAALALLSAWAIPDLLALRNREDVDGDLLGVAAIGAVVALMPLVVKDASWIADGVGVAAGIVVGLPLARLQPR